MQSQRGFLQTRLFQKCYNLTISVESISNKASSSKAYLLDEWLTPEDIAYLKKVSFPVNQRVKGMMSGTHRARLRGGTTEFAEHRSYSPGDEVRKLDWRIVGRSDRLEIKLYDDPSTFETVFLLDASGSMSFADSTRSKYHFAQSIVAFLTKAILKERDPVGLLIAGDEAPGLLWPKSSSSQLNHILQTLHQTPAAGKTRVAESLRHLGKILRNPTRVIIVSDALLDLSTLEPELAFLTGRKHRFHLIQTLSPEEITFDYKAPSRFVSLESDESLEVNPREIMDSYRAAVENHIETLRKICLANRAGYEPLVTDQQVGLSLTKFIERQITIKK